MVTPFSWRLPVQFRTKEKIIFSEPLMLLTFYLIFNIWWIVVAWSFSGKVWTKNYRLSKVTLSWETRYKLSSTNFIIVNYHFWCLIAIFCQAKKCTSYNTRLSSRHTCAIPAVRTNYGIFSIKFIGAKIWNSLDQELKILSIETFKARLKEKFVSIQWLNYSDKRKNYKKYRKARKYFKSLL